MRINTQVPDDEIMDDCVSLTYYLEFGELHERDKYSWVELMNASQATDSDEDFIFKKVKHMDFEFKMFQIRQILKIEIVGTFKNKNRLEQKIICKFNMPFSHSFDV